MIPRPFYTRLAKMQQTMVAAVSQAVVWLGSAPPTEREWERNVARLDAERGPRAVVAFPAKAKDAEVWAAECRSVWERSL